MPPWEGLSDETVVGHRSEPRPAGHVRGYRRAGSGRSGARPYRPRRAGRGTGPPPPARVNTPAGAKVKGRIFYLVPIRASGLVVPVDHIVLTAIRVQEVGSRVVIILSPGGTRVTVGFERRP